MLTISDERAALVLPEVAVYHVPEVMIMRYANVLPPIDQLLSLYSDAGWSAYTAVPELLLRAVENSLHVVTAWENDQLVGLARAVGDGVSILFVQDVLVHSSFHHSGVGTQLVAMLLSAFPAVRQVVLLTDDSPASASFYTGLGFSRAEDKACAAYVQFR